MDEACSARFCEAVKYILKHRVVQSRLSEKTLQTDQVETSERRKQLPTSWIVSWCGGKRRSALWIGAADRHSKKKMSCVATGMMLLEDRSELAAAADGAAAAACFRTRDALSWSPSDSPQPRIAASLCPRTEAACQSQLRTEESVCSAVTRV